MPGKRADNNLGLCPVMKQKSGVCSQTGAQNQFLSLSLNTTRTAFYYQMLIIHPAFYPYFYVLPRDPQGWHRSYKLLNRTVSVSLLVILFPYTPACPGTQYTPTMCWVEISFNTFWHLCTNGGVVGSLKGFQSRLLSEPVLT